MRLDYLAALISFVSSYDELVKSELNIKLSV